MPPKVRDVARLAGVSAMTVSRVLNEQPGVAAETRAKVRQAIEELKFTAPRSRSAARSRLIGIILPDVSNPFFAPIVRGAEKATRKAGYRLLICNSESDLRLERDFVTDLVASHVEGLVVAPVSEKSLPHLARLVADDFPLVLLDREVEGLNCDSVTLENVRSARELCAHLIARGHRRIGFVGDAPEVSTGRERLAGYRAALQEAGIAEEAAWIIQTTPDVVSGYRAAQQLANLADRPTAIMTVNNMVAVGVMQAMREAGLAVPREMALVCFDDVQHLAVMSPFLTVMDQPAETMAAVAAQLLLERIAGTAGPGPRNIRFPGQLIVRESCGAVGGGVQGPRVSAPG